MRKTIPFLAGGLLAGLAACTSPSTAPDETQAEPQVEADPGPLDGNQDFAPQHGWPESN